jgi:hypothetical protein
MIIMNSFTNKVYNTILIANMKPTAVEYPGLGVPMLKTAGEVPQSVV